MKLRTSFFNFGVLRKNLSRFAPLWILYAVAEVLGLLTLDLGEAAYRLADDLSYIMGPVSIFHAVYALIVAACLFGDLFDARLCNGLHAMPMRREGWLLTNLVSGLIFALIPAVVGGCFGAFMLREYWWIALVWQLTSLLQFVFFFGVAVFSAMCAGKRLGMIAIYAILNFLSELIYWVATMIYEPLLPGVVLSNDWFDLFCPVVSIAGHTYFDLTISYVQDATKVVFEGYTPETWCYLFVCAGIGVVFAVLAWLLYRKRHLETAGDFISFRPMRTFFLVSYTLAAGALLYSFGDLFGFYKNYGFLVVGILIGWFTGWMLLERTVKIFTKKVLVGFAAFAVLFAGSLGLTMLDPMGITTYIPKTENVQTACLYTLNDSYRYELKDDTGGRVLSDPEGIALVQELHSQMIEAQGTQDGEIINMELRYELKNGTRVYRSYNVPTETEVAESISGYLSNVHSIFLTNDWEEVKATADYIRVYPQGDGMNVLEFNDDAQIQALLEAIEADCEAGTLAQHDYLHVGEELVAGIDVTWTHTYEDGKNWLTRGQYLMVYENCENLIAFLETLN